MRKPRQIRLSDGSSATTATTAAVPIPPSVKPFIVAYDGTQEHCETIAQAEAFAADQIVPCVIYAVVKATLPMALQWRVTGKKVRTREFATKDDAIAYGRVQPYVCHLQCRDTGQRSERYKDWRNVQRIISSSDDRSIDERIQATFGRPVVGEAGILDMDEPYPEPESVPHGFDRARLERNERARERTRLRQMERAEREAASREEEELRRVERQLDRIEGREVYRAPDYYPRGRRW